jgi:hypothetical protein
LTIGDLRSATLIDHANEGHRAVRRAVTIARVSGLTAGEGKGLPGESTVPHAKVR